MWDCDDVIDQSYRKLELWLKLLRAMWPKVALCHILIWSSQSSNSLKNHALPISCACTKDGITSILDSLYQVCLLFIWGEWQVQNSFESCLFFLYWSFWLLMPGFQLWDDVLHLQDIPLVRERLIWGQEGVSRGLRSWSQRDRCATNMFVITLTIWYVCHC